MICKSSGQIFIDRNHENSRRGLLIFSDIIRFWNIIGSKILNNNILAVFLMFWIRISPYRVILESVWKIIPSSCTPHFVPWRAWYTLKGMICFTLSTLKDIIWKIYSKSMKHIQGRARCIVLFWYSGLCLLNLGWIFR